MCGRFTQQLTWHQIHDLYSLTGPSLPLNLQSHYNGSPTQDFAACRLDEDGNRGHRPVPLGAGALPGERLQDGYAPHQRPGRDRPYEAVVRGRISAHVSAWCQPTGGSSGSSDRAMGGNGQRAGGTAFQRQRYRGSPLNIARWNYAASLFVRSSRRGNLS